MDLMLEVGQLRKKLSSICAIGKTWVVVGLVLLIVIVLPNVGIDPGCM